MPVAKSGVFDGKWPTVAGFTLLLGLGVFFGWAGFIFPVRHAFRRALQTAFA